MFRPPCCSIALLRCISIFFPYRYATAGARVLAYLGIVTMYLPLTGIDMQVQQQKQSWHDHYKNVKAASTDNPVGEDDLVWALECVRSRAFSGSYSGKSQATGLIAQTPVMARYCLSQYKTA